uniref:Uncharacterized protein n=1 Tax=Ixodes ricinus TaxID=34613 RepID=V5IF99_IXORI
MNKLGKHVVQLLQGLPKSSVRSRRMIMKYHEPEYLQYLKPPLPVYDGLVNVQLKGYDFTVLENNARKVAKIAALFGNSGLRIVRATPLGVRSHASTYKPQTQQS